MPAGGRDHRLDELSGDQGPGGIVDGHDLGVADRLEARGHRVAPAGTARDAAHPAEPELARQPADVFVASLGTDHHHQADRGHRADALEDVGEDGAPGHVGPDLVDAGALTAACRRNDDGDAQRVPARVGRGAVRCRPSTAGRRSVAVVAKIIRPAAVWSTEVTVTCTWRSRWSRPPSTTTMVPSSR